jgi:sugar/nucleoside kinase (ribokinase family)
VTTVTAIGHVNLDHVVAVNRPIRPDVTSLIERRYSGPEGRPGGCAANIAAGLAQAGLCAEVVSFIGDDIGGRMILDHLRALGVGTRGIERDPARRTGMTWLPSVPGGESYCIYDPGGPPETGLTDTQRDRIRDSDWLVAAVGPPDPCRQALDLLADDSRLVWAVKADPGSVTRELARRLWQRADVIVLNADERGFLDERLGDGWHTTTTGALLVETDGAAGVRGWIGDRTFAASPPERLAVDNSVGAGDAFIAGLVAGLVAGQDAESAAQRGMHAAAALLDGRQTAVIRTTGRNDDEP